jgi:hypothetical protein
MPDWPARRFGRSSTRFWASLVADAILGTTRQAVSAPTSVSSSARHRGGSARIGRAAALRGRVELRHHLPLRAGCVARLDTKTSCLLPTPVAMYTGPINQFCAEGGKQWLKHRLRNY